MPIHKEKEYRTMNYKTKGTCAREIHFSVTENNTLTAVEFIGGCAGNTQGVAKLVEGMDINEAINRLEGIQCGSKGTSCPDQLSKALKNYLNQ